MSNELYLVAHKVRGEPAFDIATCEEVEGEEMWIIPTSGHRAYPYWNIKLDMLGTASEGWLDPESILNEIPASLRDHYTTSASPRKAADPAAGKALLSALGLLKPAKPIKRRV